MRTEIQLFGNSLGSAGAITRRGDPGHGDSRGHHPREDQPGPRGGPDPAEVQGRAPHHRRRFLWSLRAVLTQIPEVTRFDGLREVN